MMLARALLELARDEVTRGHDFKLVIPVCHTDMSWRTFRVGVVKTWNYLPSVVVEENISLAFKSRLDRALGVKMFKIG